MTLLLHNMNDWITTVENDWKKEERLTGEYIPGR